MKITRATSNDIPALAALVNSAYRGDHSRKGWTTEADLLDGVRTDVDTLAEMMDNKQAVFFKYTNDVNELQGCVYLEKRNSNIYAGMLTVMPAEQAKGVGKKLLLTAEDYALNENCSCIEITVISLRIELIEWYKKRGYYTTGKRISFPDDIKFGIPRQPLELIGMQKDLQHEII